MMPQSTVPHIGHKRLGFVEPVMNREVVFGRATEKFGGTDGVMPRMSHKFTYGLVGARLAGRR